MKSKAHSHRRKPPEMWAFSAQDLCPHPGIHTQMDRHENSEHQLGSQHQGTGTPEDSLTGTRDHISRMDRRTVRVRYSHSPDTEVPERQAGKMQT